MARKCSHCGRIGHNSRTCNIYINKLGGRAAAAAVSISTTSTSYPTTTCISSNSTATTIPSAGGLKLFGIQLTNPSSSSFSSNNNFSNGGTTTAIRKSFSLDSFHATCCTTSSSSPSSSSKSLSPSSSFSTNSISRIHVDELLDYRSSAINGYLSDGLITQPQERKKGVPWTEEEHRIFLIGLEKLGKGDWRGISKKFVPTRTPTQVASHAQKYFLRQATLNKKRRSSLFDDTIGRSRIGATLTSSSGITTIFPNTNITATTAHFSSNFKSELNRVEQFHHQLRYNNSWQVKDLCLDGPNSPTRGSTATVPPRPRRSDHHHLQHQAPLDHHDLQLTLRVPGLPPTRRESSKAHSVLVGTV